jgi:hypothetical protein
MGKPERPRRTTAGKHKSRLDPSPGQEGPQWGGAAAQAGTALPLPDRSPTTVECTYTSIKSELWEHGQVTPEWAHQPVQASGACLDHQCAAELDLSQILNDRAESELRAEAIIQAARTRTL